MNFVSNTLILNVWDIKMGAFHKHNWLFDSTAQGKGQP